MPSAIIDTLKAKNASGEEVAVYPRTSFKAVKNDNGKNLEDVLEGMLYIEPEGEETTLFVSEITGITDSLEIDSSTIALSAKAGVNIKSQLDNLGVAIQNIDDSLTEIINTKTF